MEARVKVKIRNKELVFQFEDKKGGCSCRTYMCLTNSCKCHKWGRKCQKKCGCTECGNIEVANELRIFERCSRGGYGLQTL